MTIFFIVAALFVGTLGFVVLFGAPYVPSHRKEVRNAFTKLYQLGSTDTLVDLGSGDGIVLLEATRKGANAFGYELNPLLVFISRIRLKNKATVNLSNMWTVRLPEDTTIVYAFIVSRDSKKLARMLSSEAARLGRPLFVMTYGEQLKGHTAVRTLRGHSLYEIQPERTLD